ncbi:CYTH and CHAD domain-containing protein [Thermoactinospora rubra]|uniref:CYTH and CHAD domain-containing protein n=1 Tax=Thermoactinospora rubra TaxID=1088767 RepID=UPI000A0FB1B3|nr:CYTH and CHAD domain-containing protein [Thermoactinospora rubra]
MGIEIEDKFDVPADYVLPDLGGLGETAGPKSYQLVALYYDTDDLRLARRGATLRRRRGGADPGWHLKLPKVKGGRQEIVFPLTRSTKVVPQELADLVLGFTRGAPLRVVAQLETKRTVVRLGDLVEVADDRVKATSLLGAPAVQRWREVEAELLNGDDKLLAKVGKRLKKAGAVPASSSSKLARLLDPPPVPRAEVAAGSAGEVVMDYLAGQVSALLGQDPRVRRAEEDAVHQMRVATRRLRSALKAFKPVVAGTREIQDELKWLAGVLGEARDLEVIRARFARRLEDLAPELVVGPIRARLGDDMYRREREAYGRIRETLGGERYFALLDALDALIAEPRLTEAAAQDAKTLVGVAGKSWARVTRAYDAAQAIEDPERREIAMHEVRKSAKRARYTAEALRPALGAKMGRLARHAEAVQEVLGAHMDGVIAQETLAKEAEAARQAGEDTFTYGLLIGVERGAAERAHAEFPEVWARTRKAVGKLL